MIGLFVVIRTESDVASSDVEESFAFDSLDINLNLQSSSFLGVVDSLSAERTCLCLVLFDNKREVSSEVSNSFSSGALDYDLLDCFVLHIDAPNLFWHFNF